MFNEVFAKYFKHKTMIVKNKTKKQKKHEWEAEDDCSSY